MSFTPAAELCGAFYREAVRPLLAGRVHAAALLGWGSDVLGYDTERSTDHGWGLRLIVFAPGRPAAQEIADDVDRGLPGQFRGWPVRFGWDAVPVSHHVTVTTVADWSHAILGLQPAAPMSVTDWLLTPQQLLLGAVSGAVFADDTGELAAFRRRLAWYPDQVWRWLIACQWRRIAEEEAFVARTAEVGDEVGSAVTAARLVRDLMRLALLLDRRYAPYQKWLGTAFTRGAHTDGLPARVTGALHARDLAERETALAAAYSAVAGRFNSLGLAEPVDPAIRSYHRRPARVLMADRFTTACLSGVTDPELTALPLIGSVDQVVDNTEVLSTPALFRALWHLYSAG